MSCAIYLAAIMARQLARAAFGRCAKDGAILKDEFEQS